MKSRLMRRLRAKDGANPKLCTFRIFLENYSNLPKRTPFFIIYFHVYGLGVTKIRALDRMIGFIDFFFYNLS
jgi:hypothetical protein